jgi:hypothetical protein
MSGTSFEIDTSKLDELMRDVPRRADEWLENAAEQVVEDVQSSFTTSPSAPGEPPGVITGALKDSVEYVKDTNGAYIVAVGEEYGLSLEFGTETIAPRPFLTPIFHLWESKFAADAAQFGIII